MVLGDLLPVPRGFTHLQFALDGQRDGARGVPLAPIQQLPGLGQLLLHSQDGRQPGAVQALVVLATLQRVPHLCHRPLSSLLAGDESNAEVLSGARSSPVVCRSVKAC